MPAHGQQPLGILFWNQELEPGRDVAPQNRQLGGLAPVVLINSNSLDVVLSRQSPLSSRALRRLVRLARVRVERLVGFVADGAGK